MSNDSLKLVCECGHPQDNHCANNSRFRTSMACSICECCMFQDRDEIQKPSPRYAMCSQKGLPKSSSIMCQCRECRLASLFEIADGWKDRWIRDNSLPPDEYKCKREGLPNLTGKDCPCPTCRYDRHTKKLCEMFHRLLCEAMTQLELENPLGCDLPTLEPSLNP